MKRFSARMIEKLKEISPAELVKKEIVQTASNFNESRQTGYICPLCGSGTGANQTGGGSFDANGRFYCHVCKNSDAKGHKLSAIDLYKIARNLQGDSFGKVVREMADEFDIDIEYDGDNKSGTTRNQNPPPSPSKPTTDAAEIELIRADLSGSDESLKSFVDSNGGFWRGLPFELLKKFGCRYVEKWTTPKSRVKGESKSPTPRILIPSGGDFYLARYVGNRDDYQAQKLNAGSPKLFNHSALKGGLVFAVEGAIDAMSVELVGFDAVATNSAGNYDLLVDAVAKMQDKPRIVILFDADDTGKTNAEKLSAALLDIGCPCVIRYLSGDESKLDANKILTDHGEENLRGQLQTIMDSSLAELDACAKAMKEKKLLDADTIKFLFEGGADDLAFARRLEKLFGNEIRWCDDESWLTFGGGVWRRFGEKNSCVLPYCRKLADILSRHAKDESSKNVAEKFLSSRKFSSAITVMKALDSIRITADDLDNHSELLNVRNGVIDLTSGKLLPAAPELLITQQAAAVYNPKSTDTTFAEFFKSVLPDTDTRAVVERFLGYCLTANVNEEKFLLVSGEGANGKGTLFLTLRTLLKDFAVELPPDAVLENRGRLTADANGRATPELIGLAKRRLGVIDELPRNGRVDVAKLKRLTGGDMIPIRRLYAEFTEIAPTHKLIMCGNYRPSLDDSRDVAFLRRLIAVKFAQDFSQNPDTDLKKKLIADSALTGALNVLVPAAVNWYRDGGLLKPSTLMNQARQEYLDENDFVGDFLSEFYTFDEKLSTPRKQLIKHLREQCAESTGYRDSDLCKMVAKVNGVICRKDATSRAMTFYGIGLKPQQSASQRHFDEFDGEILSSNDFIPPN